MTNEFYDAIQNNCNVDVIYIDFKKAFDSVPINLLLYKLKRAGITGKLLTFLENFLTNRSFRVKIDDVLSENKPINSGVPQGSVLGPLLFLIFINDLPNYISENVGIKMYADDVKLYKVHKNDRSTDLTNALIKLEKWGQLN
uniref:Reverse transcriptase domain-containing protein n=1 Tax=Meloidogyne incognita TaxID=6306 RepID=A0A914NTQ6_MELIC